jgi:hypothetical protein
MITILLMNNLLSLPLLAVLFFFVSCQNSYRQDVSGNPTGKGIVGVSEDAYQVTTEEYANFFESRYGLLFQKFNDRPFTGRILTIENGDSGDYVSSDESWTEGKKDGVSSRWFSNGVKMYERNYSEGRWHGTVTRWWPNGQKMYVRAYTNGTRHGKEATWRSDGSPIQLSKKPFIPSKPLKSDEIPAISNKSNNIESPEEPNVFPATTTELTQEPQFNPAVNSTSEPIPVADPITTESFPVVPQSPPPTESFPELPSIPENNSPSIPSDDSFPPLPSSEPVQSDNLPGIPQTSDPGFPELPGSNELPSESLPVFPPSDEGLPALPGNDSVENDLPSFPNATPSGSDFPPLPALPGGGEDNIPPLPGLPDSNDNDLPPLPGLPGDDLSGDLPPLPGTDSSDSGLPPLPTFPE